MEACQCEAESCRSESHRLRVCREPDFTQSTFAFPACRHMESFVMGATDLLSVGFEAAIFSISRKERKTSLTFCGFFAAFMTASHLRHSATGMSP